MDNNDTMTECKKLMEKMKSECNKLIRKMDERVHKEISTNQHKINKFNSKILNLENVCESQQESIGRLQKGHIDNKREIDKLKQDYKEQKNINMTLNSNNMQLMKENSKLRKEIRDKNKQIKALRQKYETSEKMRNQYQHNIQQRK